MRKSYRDKSFMIQGTSSSAGKSCITAGFLRYFSKKGFSCSPFKPQNMSLNSFVTEDGYEIARSQVMQAEAANKKPLKFMNPLLIKPLSDERMHLIVNGKFHGNMNFKEYNGKRDEFIEVVKSSFEKLMDYNEIVIVEGAGSPAEINLYNVDIANMGFAELYGVPVILVADIERGGVFASVFGTIKLLPPRWRSLVKGFIINKFRGDRSILDPGIETIRKRLKIPCLGVIPYIKDLYIVAEDSLNFLENENYNYNKNYNVNNQKTALPDILKIGIVALGHICNFNEFDPLFLDKRIDASFIKDMPQSLDAFDMIIIPGTKSTIKDLDIIKRTGLFELLRGYAGNSGGTLMGICGGFQMMGKVVKDPLHIESKKNHSEGLNFFDVETILCNEKTLLNVKYMLNPETCLNFYDAGSENIAGITVSGYEIHNGRTFFNKDFYPGRLINLFKALDGNIPKNRRCLEENEYLKEKGVISQDGKKIGTYVHGLFENDIFKEIIINHLLFKNLKDRKNNPVYKKNIVHSEGYASYSKYKDYNYDLLAEYIGSYIEMDLINDLLKIN